MRVVQNMQMQIGEVDVSKVKFDLKSRDDIPKVLRAALSRCLTDSMQAARTHKNKRTLNDL